MQRRAVRLFILALLVAAGAAAAALTWKTAREIAVVEHTDQDFAASIDRLLAASSEIASAHASSVAPAHTDRTALDRVPALIDLIRTDTIALSRRTRTSDARTLLTSVSEAAATLRDADERARENLNLGLELMAEDVIFGDARSSLDTIVRGLHQIRRAEAAASSVDRTARLQRSWTIIGGAALFWTLGLLLLVRVPRSTDSSSKPSTVLALTDDPKPAEGTIASETASSIDLAAAADLCTAISRLTDANALAPLLARASVLLNASGIIIWMGAGEELFAVTAHGYDARVVSRLGSISRTALNATASSWRTGTLRTVAGDATKSGAIVAPMFAPEQCIGVLAAEVPHPREDDPAARAVTAMIAAQLSSVVVAWPAASASPPEAGLPLQELRA